MSEIKTILIEVLVDIVDLLVKCGLDDRAGWFSKKVEVLRSLDLQSHSFEHELQEIRGILTGMGSFSDLPMYPKNGVTLTEQDARTRQWELTDKLAALIDKALDHIRKSKHAR